MFLASMSIINLNPLVSKSNIVINNEGENIDGLQKNSLIEDWDLSFDAGKEEYGEGIAIDESTGDVFVVGHNGTWGVDLDVLLIKYNSAGDQQWNVTWGDGRDEYGYDVAVDSQGYVYVVGTNGTGGINYDVLLIKFNSSGEQEWIRTWDSGNYEAGWDLKLDSQDNIYLVGEINYYDILLLKYNSSGVLKWNSTFGGVDYQVGHNLVLDSSNNIYVAGLNRSNSQFDLLLIKFNSSGFHVWNRTWGGTGNEQGYGVVLDSGNNVYISGWTQSFGASLKDMVVVKYDSAGNWQWNRTWGTSLQDEPRSIAVDSADNIYMYGFTNLANVSIVTYSASGVLISNKQWGNNPTYQYWGQDIEIDSSDKIYITGYNRTGTFSIYDIFLVKLSIEAIPSPPGSFELSSNAGIPDDDGTFMLSWTSASGANNYSIYQYSSLITKINDSLTVLANETNALSLPLSSYSNGTYYFVAVAFNNDGNKSSNVLSIIVELLGDTSTTPGIPGFNLTIVGLVIGIVSVILIKKKNKSNN